MLSGTHIAGFEIIGFLPLHSCRIKLKQIDMQNIGAFSECSKIVCVWGGGRVSEIMFAAELQTPPCCICTLWSISTVWSYAQFTVSLAM